MALYAIGDIQGCYDQLRRLLDSIGFDDSVDTLWLTGDLVNRGPKSLQTLRFIRGLNNAAQTVLGNHDLHLIAAANGHVERKHAQSLDDVLNAPDCDELIDWLCQQPLLHHDPKRALVLVHAGIHPAWSIDTAIALSGEVQTALRGEDRQSFLATMYGNRPRRWRETLSGAERLRFITNVLTRMRYLDTQSRLSLKFKGPPGEQPEGLIPWFEASTPKPRTSRIIFGHWSSLGVVHNDAITGLDSGCLWGRCLTAVTLDPEPIKFKQHRLRRFGDNIRMTMSDSPRYNVTVDVETEYLIHQSEPEKSRYVFAYHITINNHGELPAQLLTRHWIITDANEGIEEVRGDGVIGEQPNLEPGAKHQYSSGAIIKTPIGTMSGSYQMVAADGTHFDAPVETFVLSIPGQLH